MNTISRAEIVQGTVCTPSFLYLVSNDQIAIWIAFFLTSAEIWALCRTCPQLKEVFIKYLHKPVHVYATQHRCLSPSHKVVLTGGVSGLDIPGVHYGADSVYMMTKPQASVLNVYFENHDSTTWKRTLDLQSLRNEMRIVELNVHFDDMCMHPSTLILKGVSFSLRTVRVFGHGNTNVCFTDARAPNLKLLHLVQVRTVVDLAPFTNPSDRLVVSLSGGTFGSTSSIAVNSAVVWIIDNCMLCGGTFVDFFRTKYDRVFGKFPTFASGCVTFGKKSRVTIPPADGNGWKPSSTSSDVIYDVKSEKTRHKKIITYRVGSAERVKHALLKSLDVPGSVCVRCDAIPIAQVRLVVGTEVPRLCHAHTTLLYKMLAVNGCFDSVAFHCLVFRNIILTR